MLVADIYLNLDQIKSEVILFNDKKLTEINKTMASSQNAINRLSNSAWQGETKDAFMANFEDYKRDLIAFNEQLKDFNTCLKTVQSEGMKTIMQGSKIAAKL